MAVRVLAFRSNFVETERDCASERERAMAPVLETIHMVAGDGDTSYSRNSTLPVSFYSCFNHILFVIKRRLHAVAEELYSFPISAQNLQDETYAKL